MSHERRSPLVRRIRSTRDISVGTALDTPASTEIRRENHKRMFPHFMHGESWTLGDVARDIPVVPNVYPDVYFRGVNGETRFAVSDFTGSVSPHLQNLIVEAAALTLHTYRGPKEVEIFLVENMIDISTRRKVNAAGSHTRINGHSFITVATETMRRYTDGTLLPSYVLEEKAAGVGAHEAWHAIMRNNGVAYTHAPNRTQAEYEAHPEETQARSVARDIVQQMRVSNQLHHLDIHHAQTGFHGVSTEPVSAGQRGTKEVWLPSEMMDTWYPGPLRRLETGDAIMYEHLVFPPDTHTFPRIRQMNHGTMPFQIAELVDTPEHVVDTVLQSSAQTLQDHGIIPTRPMRIIFSDVIAGTPLSNPARYLPQSGIIAVGLDNLARESQQLHAASQLARGVTEEFLASSFRP